MYLDEHLKRQKAVKDIRRNARRRYIHRAKESYVLDDYAGRKLSLRGRPDWGHMV